MEKRLVRQKLSTSDGTGPSLNQGKVMSQGSFAQFLWLVAKKKKRKESQGKIVTASSIEQWKLMVQPI